MNFQSISFSMVDFVKCAMHWVPNLTYLCHVRTSYHPQQRKEPMIAFGFLFHFPSITYGCYAQARTLHQSTFFIRLLLFFLMFTENKLASEFREPTVDVILIFCHLANIVQVEVYKVLFLQNVPFVWTHMWIWACVSHGRWVKLKYLCSI